MSGRYTLILRECSEAAKAHVAQFLGRAFSLKEATCQTIAGSAPIALLSDLAIEEAAAMQLVMRGLAAEGVTIEYSSDHGEDLPKIDWPRRPAVFKRDIAEYVEDLKLAVPCAACKAEHPLLALLVARIAPGSASGSYVPAEAPVPAQAGATTGARPAVDSKPFKGAHLPEITPFSTPVLPPQAAPPQAAKPPTGNAGTRINRTPMPQAPAADADVGSRLNELFPEEEGQGGFLPDNNDITSILNRLLPDEEGSGVAPAPGTSSSSGRLSAAPIAGFSVFLAKIGDDARRQKAVPIIAELAKISTEEAEALSKKVIIPVLKGVSKDEAEAAKQKFAKIGILARVKGAETVG